MEMVVKTFYGNYIEVPSDVKEHYTRILSDAIKEIERIVKKGDFSEYYVKALNWALYNKKIRDKTDVENWINAIGVMWQFTQYQLETDKRNYLRYKRISSALERMVSALTDLSFILS